MKKDKGKKKKVKLRRILVAFLIYYLVGVVVLPVYLFVTYPSGQCLSEECPGARI